MSGQPIPNRSHQPPEMTLQNILRWYAHIVQDNITIINVRDPIQVRPRYFIKLTRLTRIIQMTQPGFNPVVNWLRLTD